jgi:hypothetical protein
VGLVAVVRMDHKMDWRLSNHFLPQALSLALKVLVLCPLRTSALARSAWPLLLGLATEAKQNLMPTDAQYSRNSPLVN